MLRSSARSNVLSPRRIFVFSAAMCWLAACSSGRSSRSEDFDPPSLQFVGAENANSDRFELEDEVIEVACDSRLTFLLGPSTEAEGLLDDWVMRPAGNCQSFSQCGFIRLDLLDADAESIASVRAAGISIVVDTQDLDLDRVESVWARLVDGNSGRDFVVVDEETEETNPVTALWEVRLQRSSNCGGMGGSSLGGSGNLGGSP